MIALQAAITRYRDVCQQEIAKESGAPYWAHNEALQRISLKLLEKMQLTSLLASETVPLSTTEREQRLHERQCRRSLAWL